MTKSSVGVWRNWALSAGVLAAIFCFYLWTVSQGLPIRFGTSDGFYPPLTDGFLAGQLSLPIEPHPDLLKQKDPYDPAHRAPFLHDASLYKGKYYAYFGVTPVLLLFLPFRLLGIGNLPESVGVAVFVFGSLLFALATLSVVRRTAFPSIERLPYALYLMLGLGGAIPYFLRRPAVYEVAIACGSFCLMAGIYFLVSLEANKGLWRAALASLFLGLAVGARPHLLLASPLLLLAAWRLCMRERRWPSIGEAAALFAPIALVGVALAVYNYARFDSWTEFGRWYQLAGEPVRDLKFDLRRVPFSSYLYLWHAGSVNLAFPYTHVKRVTSQALSGLTLEPLAGLFYSTPILYVLALLPLLRTMRRAASPGTAPALESAQVWAWALVTLALVQVLFLGSFPGITMRYIVDFSLLLMLAAGIVMMAIATRLETSRWRGWAKKAMTLLIVVTVFMNAGLGIRGYYDNLQGANPSVYTALKRSSDGVVDAIVPWIFRKDLQLLLITAPGGVTQDVGVPSFWVGDAAAEFEVFAKRAGFVHFSAVLAVHPDLKSLTNLRLTAAADNGESRTLVADGQETRFALPVRRGHNRVVVRMADLPAVPEQNKAAIVEFKCNGWTFSTSE